MTVVVTDLALVMLLIGYKEEIKKKSFPLFKFYGIKILKLLLLLYFLTVNFIFTKLVFYEKI